MKSYLIKTNITFLILIFCMFASQANAQSDLTIQKPANISEGNWASLKNTILETKILPEDVSGDGGQQSFFGRSLSVDGTRAVIGAPGMLAHGVVYVFEFDGVDWIRTARIEAEDAEIRDQFGSAVSLNGDRLLIGNFYESNNGSFAGAAYIFELENGTWVQKDKFTADDIAGGYAFGISVSLLGDRALIGARGAKNANGESVGAAYVFELVTDEWVQIDKLLASDGESNDEFAASVHLDNDRAIIGAAKDDDIDTDSGAAYIFDLSAGTWSQTVKITSSDSLLRSYFGTDIKVDGSRAVISAVSSSDMPGVFSVSTYVYELVGAVWTFSTKLEKSSSNVSSGGYSVDLSGDTIVVGSIDSVYVFKNLAGIWSESDNLVSSDFENGDQFGRFASLSGDTLLVSSLYDRDYGISSGSAYIFDFSNTTWTESTKLRGDTGGQYNSFGNSVSVSGDLAVIGVQTEDDNGLKSGAAYVYALKSGSWVQEDRLTASDGISNHFFGGNVDIDGERIVVSAVNDNQVANTAGAVYIYDKDINGVWVETKIVASDGTNFDRFGTDLSLDGDILVVGSEDDENGTRAGSAYVFEKKSGAWVELVKLLPSDIVANDYFGRSVSIDKNVLVIGAERHEVNGVITGAVYIYEYLSNMWTQTDKITATNSINNQAFGLDVDLDGNRLLVGSNSGAFVFDYANNIWSETQLLSAPALRVSLDGDIAVLAHPIIIDGPIRTGLSHVYELSSGIWYPTAVLRGDGVENGQFGSAVFLQEDTAFVGAAYDDDLGYQSGSVYVFDIDVMPDAFANSLTIDEDENGVIINVLTNDTDVDGGPMLIENMTQPLKGVVTNNSVNLTYTPNEDYCNSDGALDTFNYTLNGGSTASVSVSVNCVDDRPLAFGNFATLTEDSEFVMIDVLSNDTDVDGGPKIVESVTQPSNGIVINNATSLSYKPNLDYCNSDGQEDIFDYSLNGGSTTSVFVRVECVDDLPIAIENSVNLDEDSSSTMINVLANDTDVDGGPISIVSVSQPDNGTVINNISSLNYIPDPDYCNTGSEMDVFNYTLQGGSSASVSVDVNCIDDFPMAVAQLITISEDDPATEIEILKDVIDIDDGPKTIEFVTQPENGIVVNNSSNLTYLANENYCNDKNDTDDFVYRLNGGSEATVSVQVNCVNDQPNFQLLCDIDATEVVGENYNQVTIENFAHSVIFGPPNESQQSIVGYMTSLNDPSTIISSVNINQDGLLDIEFSLNYGVATIDVILQDDGGRDFNGDDLSVAKSFNVIYSDFGLDNELIFKNGFDIGCGLFAFKLLKN
ncbi:MAG: Ig-like domain-containing protein [Marinicellaceae bacterium]